MPFVKRAFHLEKPIKAFLFAIRQFNFTQGEAQSLISRGRILINGQSIYDKAAIIQGDIEVVYFEPRSRGIQPIFVNPNFLIFDKPSGVLVHPNTMSTEYSMLDEIRHHSGQHANASHRIDMETSGLLIASRHKDAERIIKGLFEHKTITKRYLAWVVGRIDDPFEVEAPIAIRQDYTHNKHKVAIHPQGKYAKTLFKPLLYDATLDTTLVECTPITGRTHQIRIHLFHVKHPILGDPIYGTAFEASDAYLNGSLSLKDRYRATGATRLMLHAYRLSFPYGAHHEIVSRIDFKEARTAICPKAERLFFSEGL